MGNQIMYIVVFAIFIWLGGISFYLYKTVLHYRKLVGETRKENLESVLEVILGNIKNQKDEINEIKRKLQQMDFKSVNYVQKVGMLRFNPFEDTGGDQSFVLALLDGKDNGIVLTSLHGRGVTRWYAKNVKEGKGTDHKLSEEEEKAIKQVVLLRTRKV